MLTFVMLLPASAHAGVLRGVIWPTRAEAARVTAARATGSYATRPARRTGFFAWLTQPVPASEQVSGNPPGVHPSRTTVSASPVQPGLKRQIAMREAIVYLQTVPPKVESGLAAKVNHDRNRHNARIVQANSTFTPRVTAVTAGSPVEFQNLDRVWHNAFSVSRANRFDLGKYPPGRVDTVQFDHPGLVNLHCDIHPEESGFVLVVPNHAYVRPDSLGRFTLPKLPPGPYILRLWHPRLGENSFPIEMPRHGDLNVDVAF
jgi:plastocyanin